MSKMKTPSSKDLALAAMWLRDNEGDEDESGAMNRVADWLESIEKKRYEDALVREIRKTMPHAKPKQIREFLRKRAD